MAEDRFYSFEEALKELRLKEEELKRLVSEGEIRAFRQGDTMRLRQSDVEALKKELTGGEVVDLGDVKEELVFEDDVDLDAGMATQEIAEVDTIIEDDVVDVGELDLEEAAAVEEVVEEEVVERRTVAREVVVEEATEGLGMRFLLVATTVLLVLALPVCLALSTGRASGIAASLAGMFG